MVRLLIAERNAAVKLLRGLPEDCERRAPLGKCGRCLTCRVRLFLAVVDHENRAQQRVAA